MDTINKKKSLFQIGLYMLVVTALFLLCELINLLAPLFSQIHKGDLNQLIVVVIKIVLYTTILISAIYYSTKKMKLPLNNDKTELSLKRLILIYVIAILAVVVISATLGFKVKLAVDMGENITGPILVTNILTFILRIIRMGLICLIIKHAQLFLETIINKPWATKLPLGGLISMVLMGIPILFFDGINGLNILLLFYHVLYGELYLLTNKHYTKTFVVCFFIELL